MPSETRVFVEPVPLAGRLHEMGVEQNVLRDAVEFGMRHAFDCTRHEPPNLPGILAWGKTVRSLRDSLVPQGWKASNARNYATVIHPRGTYAIAVAAGNSNTGVSDESPSTRAEKGPATRDAVHLNQLTFWDISESFPRPELVPGTQTWLLLHYADEETEEIRLELSLPAGMTSDGHVTVWQERLILSPVPFFTRPSVSTEESEGEDVQVDVQRRVS